MKKYLIIIAVFLDLLWANNIRLLIYPSTYKAKPPSQWLKESPEIQYLMKQKGGFKVSGLDFPFYCGHWVKLRTLGYMGGFRDKKLSEYLGGKDGTNTWNRSYGEAREFGIKYFLKEKKLYELAKEANLIEVLVTKDNELCSGS